MPTTPTATFKLTPRQADLNRLLGGPQRHTMFVGGSRSGKTYLLTRAILIRALRADYSRHAVLRLRSNSARSTIWLDTLPKVARLCFPGLVLKDHRQDGFISLPNGSEIWIGGLDDANRVEKILGMEFTTIYFNEGSQIPYSSILVALTRLAQNVSNLRQRAYYDLNPVGKGHWSYRLFLEHTDPESRQPLADPNDYRYAFLNPLDNAENLTPEYLSSLATMPEKRRRRFYSGEYVEEIDGALWTVELLERAKVSPSDVPSTLQRVVVAVDPSGTDGNEDGRSDEVGIIVAARGDDGRAYVLADLTCNLPPEGWGRLVVAAYERYKADAVIAERNFGGDMVRYVIQSSTQQPVPVYMVSASRGKAIRAEPVSALYGSSNDANHPGRVFHVWDEANRAANFSALEDELLQFSTGGYQGSRSPNRADSCVAEGSLVETDRGSIPIEQIKAGDRVLTRRGYRRVLVARKTQDATEVMTVITTAGQFTATGDHLVWTEERGWCRVDALIWGDTLCHISSHRPPPSSMVSNTDETRNLRDGICGFTPMYGVKQMAVKNQEPARVSVAGRYIENKRASVYDLMIEGEHEFFADGNLVHNCVYALSHLLLGDRSIALAPPILVRRAIHSPDTDPAPRVEYPAPRSITLDPSEYETITDRRGW